MEFPAPLLAAVQRDRWVPGIGDPTPVGWLTVGAYLAAAYACWRAALRRGGGRRSRAFWWILALSLLGLGLNKQLDLQSALTVWGRRLAIAQGWYQDRRPVQAAFIAALGLAGLVGFALLLGLSRPLTRGRTLALAGLVFLISFVLIRAASFHHVDRVLGASLAGLRWNGILELSGITCVGSGAWFDRSGKPAAGGANRR